MKSTATIWNTHSSAIECNGGLLTFPETLTMTQCGQDLQYTMSNNISMHTYPITTNAVTGLYKASHQKSVLT